LAKGIPLRLKIHLSKLIWEKATRVIEKRYNHPQQVVYDNGVRENTLPKPKLFMINSELITTDPSSKVSMRQ
jgi:hypothetical protein